MLKIPVEVYSRVVGYFRPVNQWNKSKQEEFRERKNYVIKENFDGSDIDKMRKKENHKQREMKKFGNQIVQAAFAKANDKDFWYKKFMDYVLAKNFRGRLGVAYNILFKRIKIVKGKPTPPKGRVLREGEEPKPAEVEK